MDIQAEIRLIKEQYKSIKEENIQADIRFREQYKSIKEENESLKQQLVKIESTYNTANNPQDRRSIFQNFMDFTQSTTLHGMKYIFVPDRNHLRRLLWIVVCLATASSYLYFASKSVGRYQSYPTTSNYDFVFEEEPTFPAMTICHYNSVRKSYLQPLIENGSFPAEKGWKFAQQQVRLGNIALQITGGQNYSLTDLALGFYLNFTSDGDQIRNYIQEQNLSTGVSFLEDVRRENAKGSISIDVRKNIEYYSAYYAYTSIEERTILNSLWKAEMDRINIEELYLKGGHPVKDMVEEIFFNNDTHELSISYTIKSELFGIFGLCHTLTFTDPRINSSITGNIQSSINLLFVRLYSPNRNEKSYWRSHNLAIRPSLFVKLHHPDENVKDLDSNSFVHLTPPLHYHIHVKRSDFHYLPAPHGNPDCIDTMINSYENPLKYYTRYSYLGCMKECKNTEIIKHCSCSWPGFPHESVPICNYSSMDVLEDGCARRIHNTKITCPKCLRSCHQTKYDTEVRIGLFADIPSMYLHVGVDLKEFGYTNISQSAAYPGESLFAEAGGLLGLYLGASLLTVVEFIDVICMAAVKSIRMSIRSTKIMAFK